MTSHLDWDWLLPFPILLTGPGTSAGAASVYFPGGENPPNGPALTVLGEAAEQLAQDPSYRFMVVEMGFLRAFAATEPQAFAAMAAAGPRVHLCGAGITSPDSLLPHVEAFFRNYLLGRVWAERALPDARISQSYVPDGFGHDPELPATLAAMGIGATAFARLPGHWGPGEDPRPPVGLHGRPTQAASLFAGGQIDFVWSARDGSSVIAHWMPDWYSGTGIGVAPDPQSIADALATSAGPAGEPPTLIGASPTQYAYTGLGNDFRLPIPRLPGVFAEWNANPRVEGVDEPVYCALGTFDDFVALVSGEDELQTLGERAPQPMFTTPYYVGSQATRPPLKILHQRAVRALLAAETFAAASTARGWGVSDAAAVAGAPWPDLLDEAWELVVPSTHHDYVNGTGHWNVYRTEQLPLLEQAVARAEWLRDDATGGIADRIAPPAGSNRSVAVFNSAGFARTVLAECPPGALAECPAATGNGVTSVVQPSAEGGALFLASLPAQGYAVVTGTTEAAGAPAFPASAVRTGDDTVTLTNERLSVVVTSAGGWAVSSIVDEATGTELVAPGATANAVAIYDEYGGDAQTAGNEYVLGCERGGAFDDITPSLAAGEIDVIESGPLRARVRATFTCPAPGAAGAALTFTREYSLHCGEAILRMSLTGRAPDGTSVVVKAPLADAIDTITRGTPGHWTDQMPQLLWNQLTTYACHHFTIPSSKGRPLAQMLHADVHAWGLWKEPDGAAGADGTLYGVILRNPTGDYFDWTYPPGPYPGGTDPDVHTRCYALGAPAADGTAADAVGRALRDGMSFATPPLAAPLTEYLTEAAPETLSRSAMSFADAAEPALVTAVKLGARDRSASSCACITRTPTGRTWSSPSTRTRSPDGHAALLSSRRCRPPSRSRFVPSRTRPSTRPPPR